MCDSDEVSESNRGIDLTGLLFGNIDEAGRLQDDGLLDSEAKQMLSSLSQLGLGSLLSEVLEPNAEIDGDEDRDFSIKSPSAQDFFDIEETAEDHQDFKLEEDTIGKSEEYTVSEATEENVTAGLTENNIPNGDNYSKQDGNELVDESGCGPGVYEKQDYSLVDGYGCLESSYVDDENFPQSDYAERMDDGYEGDMEVEEGLMPPPHYVPNERRLLKKPLDTPLAAMLPSKYADIDVTEIFPDFRYDKVLRFSRIFGPGKPSSLPQIWRGVKKRRRRKRTDSGGSDGGFNYEQSPALEPASDDEEKLMRPMQDSGNNNNDSANDKNNANKPSNAPWRFGPAQVWYDMLNVPESGDGFNYGFKAKPPSPDDKEDIIENCFPDEAYLMVSQLQWEDDVIWDGNEIKNKVLARLNSKSNAAGWLPTPGSRTAQQFSRPPTTGAPTPKVQVPPAPSSQAANTQNQTNANPTGEDDTWYSIFPVENEELVYGSWEDEVIWDAENVKKIPKPKILTLDPNDENIVLGIPDDVDPSKITRERGPQPKVKIPHPHVKKSKLLLGKAGVINVLQEDAPPPPPKSPDRDPFNISNDVYYTAKTSTLRLKVGGTQLIQHSTPVVELRAPFVQTHMGPARLRAFHRPALRKLSHGPLASNQPHPVQPLVKHLKKKAKQREQERLASGGGDVFFMRTAEDLSGKDGGIVLVEFCEEHPPLISMVGMCTKVKNYYKRMTGKDPGPKPLKYGEIAYAHTSPFLGILPPGQTQQVVENNMYRAPIYEHSVPQTDFLVIRTRQAYFIREINALFMAGQECPLYEVPGPNSKRANNFVRDFLQVFIYRLFWRSRDNPRRIKMDDIKKAFPSHSESSIRKRLKLCADFKRTGLDSNWWVIKPDFRLPSEEEIRAMVSPEQCCAYFSMAAAEQRLKDAGYGEKFIFAQQEDDDEEMQLKMDDEVKVAPWNTTRAYIQAMKGKCLLQLTGPADPTGCGEGFSYVRVPNKPTQQPTEEQQPKRTVTGTDADLRRLSLNNAKALLRKFGVPEDEIKKLSRWEVIDVVRTLSTEKAKAGEEGMTKFSRGNRFSIAEHQERYKEECQRVFELQNRVLSSTEVLSTDEAESSVSEESDLEEMGKNLENMLANKKTTEQLSMEREEAERAELRKMIMEGQSEKKSATDQKETAQAVPNPGSRVLRIVRTFKNAQGGSYTRVEYVRKSAVIEAYTKIRTTKDDAFIRQFATMDDAQKEEMKREKRRIQEQLRRIKRNQERERLAGTAAAGPFASFNPGSNDFSPGAVSGGMIPLGAIKQEDGVEVTPRTKRRYKQKTDLRMKCGACGAVGHMRTNKTCPLWTATSGDPNHEPELRAPEEDDLVNVDGTKLTLTSKLIKLAEHQEKEERKKNRERSGRPGRPKVRRPTQENDPEPYLVKRPAARRRTDPLVTLSSLLEDVLNYMRGLPDVQPFLFPVNAKLVADYYRIITRPMDLQTIRDNLRQKRYQSREDFLADVNQIVENSHLYNGSNSSLTVAAQRMLQRCVEKLAEKEEVLMKLEKAINPLLDDNDQVALSFILESLLSTKLKVMPEAWPFLKPVNKKLIKDYYSVIKKPIDLETIGKKIQAHKYHSRQDFIKDIELLAENCRAYNGPNSQFSQQAEAMLKMTKETLSSYGEEVNQMEANIALVQVKMREERAMMSSDEGLPPPPISPPQQVPRGRGRPRKRPLDPSKESISKKPHLKVKKEANLEDDLQYSGSESSELEEVDDGYSRLSVPLTNPNIKTEPVDHGLPYPLMQVKEEPPEEMPSTSSDHHMPLTRADDMARPPVLKQEPMDIPQEPHHDQPHEPWPPVVKAIQDDLAVTDSEAEDGLWF